MKIPLLALALALLVSFGAGCKSKPTTMTDQMAPALSPDVAVGSYYRLRGMTTNFYLQQPDSLIAIMPARMLGPRSVVQLLDPNAGNGWARVRTSSDDIGYVKFSSIKIVPFEKQPRAPKRKKQWYDE
ncbi:MAG: hypothetical protein KA004_03105 [Verrucomicrobiales bacterium]|nr:hypothetical protein [Verrucomicrobiales bacterium]